MSKPELGHMNRLFMELRSAGINPFKVPKDKQSLLKQYNDYRMGTIAQTGKDPYPDYKHFEIVLGKKVADEMRKKNPTPRQDDGEEDISSEVPPPPPSKAMQSAKQKMQAPSAQTSPPKDSTKPSVNSYGHNIAGPYKGEYQPGNVPQNRFQKPGMAKPTSDAALAQGMAGNQAPPLPQNFGGKKPMVQNPKAPGNAPPVPVSDDQMQQTFGDLNQKMGQIQQQSNQKKPNAPAQSKVADASLNQMNPQAVKASPIKQVGNQPAAMNLPDKENAEPVQLPKMSDFFGMPPQPATDDELAALPLPPEDQKTADLQQLMKDPRKWDEFKNKHPAPKKAKAGLSLSDAMPEIPVQDNGKELQAGSVEQPAFGPPPSSTPNKKRVSSKKRSK
jgi:hypothetical protein